MLTAVWQRLEGGIKRFIPLILAVFLAILGAVPWPAPDVGTVAPMLVLSAVYYWAIHRPDMFGPFSAFMVGILHDAMNFLPFGVSSFLFVAMHQLALSQRRFFVGQPFYMLWAGFAVVAAMTVMGQWILMSVYNSKVVLLLPVLVQMIFTIVLFPLLAWGMIKLQRVAMA